MDFEIGSSFFSQTTVNAGDYGHPLFAHASESLNSSDGGGKEVHLAVTGKTYGPLRWFKAYRARAELMVYGQSRSFILEGEDNGVKEKRVLVFAPDSPPMIEFFFDSAASKPLGVQDSWKNDTVDPLTVFEWIIFSATKGQSCAKKFWIYDGKRRYAAQTMDFVENTDPAEVEKLRFPANSLFDQRNRPFNCRLTLIGSDSSEEKVERVKGDIFSEARPDSTLEQSSKNIWRNDSEVRDKNVKKPRALWRSVWPFGRADRNIDFRLRICSTQRVIVERVEMSAPIGKIIGRSANSC